MSNPSEKLREIAARLPNAGGAWDDAKADLREIADLIESTQGNCTHETGYHTAGLVEAKQCVECGKIYL